MDLKVDIQDRPDDPVAKMHVLDAYMRWALMAVEEVVGKQGLNLVLRDSHLERFIDNYPAEILTISGDITAQDFADLCTGVIRYYGRAGKGLDYRIARLSAKYGIRKQAELFNVAIRPAIRALPLDQQLAIGLDNQINGWLKLWHDYGENPILRKEDRGDKFAYIFGTCTNCAGKLAGEPICHSMTGALLETTEWVTGKRISVKEVECRAMGADACVWEINKKADE